jgi:hypothetical protein
MALVKKPAPKGTKLKVGGDDNYASATVKGKGPSKMQDVKACNKKMKK